jgi:uncharacterized protein YqgC (DUF456 family)
MSAYQVFIAALTFVIMLIGVAGVALPVIPDVWLIWLAALGYGALAGFNGWVGGVAMAALTVLAVLGMVIDLALGHAAAKRGGASWQAIAASIVLGLAGLFFYPPLGPIAGALLGLFLVEFLLRGRNARHAWTAVKSYALGSGLSIILRLTIAVVMIGVWLGWLVIAAQLTPVS